MSRGICTRKVDAILRSRVCDVAHKADGIAYLFRLAGQQESFDTGCRDSFGLHGLHVLFEQMADELRCVEEIRGYCSANVLKTEIEYNHLDPEKKINSDIEIRRLIDEERKAPAG